LRVIEPQLGYRTTSWPSPRSNDRWEDRTWADPWVLHRAWGEFIGRIPWEWFVTLTFDPKRRFPVSRELASREAFIWCGLVGLAYRRAVTWVYAVERNASGLHHVHVLAAGLPNPRWSVVVEVWRERNGRMVDIREVSYEPPRLALYACKSAASDGEIVLSDTVERYRKELAGEPIVILFADER